MLSKCCKETSILINISSLGLGAMLGYGFFSKKQPDETLSPIIDYKTEKPIIEEPQVNEPFNLGPIINNPVSFFQVLKYPSLILGAGSIVVSVFVGTRIFFMLRSTFSMMRTLNNDFYDYREFSYHRERTWNEMSSDVKNLMKDSKSTEGNFKELSSAIESTKKDIDLMKQNGMSQEDFKNLKKYFGEEDGPQTIPKMKELLEKAGEQLNKQEKQLNELNEKLKKLGKEKKKDVPLSEKMEKLEEIIVAGKEQIIVPNREIQLYEGSNERFSLSGMQGGGQVFLPSGLDRLEGSNIFTFRDFLGNDRLAQEEMRRERNRLNEQFLFEQPITRSTNIFNERYQILQEQINNSNIESREFRLPEFDLPEIGSITEDTAKYTIPRQTTIGEIVEEYDTNITTRLNSLIIIFGEISQAITKFKAGNEKANAETKYLNRLAGIIYLFISFLQSNETREKYLQLIRGSATDLVYLPKIEEAFRTNNREFFTTLLNGNRLGKIIREPNSLTPLTERQILNALILQHDSFIQWSKIEINYMEVYMNVISEVNKVSSDLKASREIIEDLDKIINKPINDEIYINTKKPEIVKKTFSDFYEAEGSGKQDWKENIKLKKAKIKYQEYLDSLKKEEIE